MAITETFLVDLVGRRRLLMFTNPALGLVWLGMTIATSLHVQAARTAGTARAILALIFPFDVIYACGFTSVQVLYAIEVLTSEMRAKVYAFTAVFINTAGFFNPFASPVALAWIGWKTYILLMFWRLLQAAVVYVVILETRYRPASIQHHSTYSPAPCLCQCGLARRDRWDLQGEEFPQGIGPEFSPFL